MNIVKSIAGSWRFRSRLSAARACGPVCRMRSIVSARVASSSACGTTRATRPMASASAAVTSAAVKRRSFARAMPTRLASRAPRKQSATPRSSSGARKVARSEATARSAVSVRLSPPPWHMPSIPSTTSFGQRSNCTKGRRSMPTRRTPSAVPACRWREPRSIALGMSALYHRGGGGCHGGLPGANRDAMAKAVPEGHHTVTPHLTVRGAARAIDFYRRAFGAEEVMRMPSRDGTKLMHAHLRIGDSAILLNDEFPEMGGRSPEALGGTPTTIHLYVSDADQVFARAVAAGAQVRMPLQDMFWGDRYGQIVDPFGHVWAIATHKEDLTPEEIARRAAASVPR